MLTTKAMIDNLDFPEVVISLYGGGHEAAASLKEGGMCVCYDPSIDEEYVTALAGPSPRIIVHVGTSLAHFAWTLAQFVNPDRLTGIFLGKPKGVGQSALEQLKRRGLSYLNNTEVTQL